MRVRWRWEPVGCQVIAGQHYLIKAFVRSISRRGHGLVTEDNEDAREMERTKALMR